MAKESPTSTISTPARSAASPLGKSCAVTMEMGVPFLYKLRRVLMVTLFRCGTAVGDMGLWELYRHCCHCTTAAAAGAERTARGEDRRWVARRRWRRGALVVAEEKQRDRRRTAAAEEEVVEGFIAVGELQLIVKASDCYTLLGYAGHWDNELYLVFRWWCPWWVVGGINRAF